MNPDLSITACSPAEAVAVVPYLLGFHPADSFVVLGLIGRVVDFAVRYDLPPSPGRADYAEVAIMIARQAADRVMLIGYGPPGPVSTTVLGVGRALTIAGVAIDDVLRVADGRWWSYAGGPAGGTECAPELAAEAVFQGMVALPDRKALVAKVSPVEGAQRREMTEATGRARARATDLAAGDLRAGRGGQWMRRAGREAVREAERVARVGQSLGADAVAWLGVVLVKPVVLDYAIDRSAPDDWRLDLWNDVVRRVDPAHAPGPACLLGYAAWQAGDGSLARVAVDRALLEEPGHRLAGVLDRLLAAGIRPDSVVRFSTPRRTGPPGRARQRLGTGGGRRRRRGTRRRSL